MLGYAVAPPNLQLTSAIAIPRKLGATLAYCVRKDIVQANVKHDTNAR